MTQEVDFYRSIIDGARRFATEGHSSVETVQWLYSEVRVALDGRPAIFPFMNVLFKTFELDYATALHTQHWSGFEWGGHLSDDELEQLLSPLIPRADDLFPGRA